MRDSSRFSLIRKLLKFSQFIDNGADKLGWLSNWLVLLTIGVGFFNVVARYMGRFIGVQLSSNALLELQWYLFSLTFLFGFVYILRHGENVRVDFLYTNMSEKKRALVDFVGTVLFLIPFCLLGIWVTINPVLQSWGRLSDGSWGTWEISSDANGLPRAPIKTMVPIALLLLLLQSISQAIKYLAVLLGYQQVEDQLRLETSENINIE
ncbi:MAG: TRAP transporter small permease subunit [Dolichospermum sp. OL03]|jgi:TRAP-type mannitol/chloroaromatic compound transport system permease small subunit|uniref:TRAP transporter small permease subunit n=1 Tax=Dolichospermum flosaquae TaxID=1166 RepID=UPI000801D0A4|nr:TRAP transporter small permease subunit [Dolichospermum flos-aquae]MBS9390408.1 TRAP transporter small permease subunit [Dolichospermum sp. WA123]MBS9393649.1 TRAP transporter small permease subunit [Dolichospermum sp. OL01]MCO5797281.1 TRAP transporter small permease subunit [Dolichospermum sp. OL03]MCS6281742.1 TRAP transporter small permease subunit [Dolichospermum sp.]OBQ32486.1 MAG: C4-dicarboxylate ABC transporter substrate-binding protein [Anabaena sp. MDT14b]